MKRLNFLLITCAILGLTECYAQKNSSFFLKVNTNGGAPLENLIIELSPVTGIFTQKEPYSPQITSFDVTPFIYSFGVQGGWQINDRWFISTGLRYTKRVDEALPYCHVCDIFYSETSKLNLETLEVPLSLRYNINNKSKFFPFISGDVYWSQMLSFNRFNFWAYQIGGGIGFRTQKNTEFLLKTQYNRDISSKDSYPTIFFREISIGLEGLFKF